MEKGENMLNQGGELGPGFDEIWREDLVWEGKRIL